MGGKRVTEFEKMMVLEMSLDGKSISEIAELIEEPYHRVKSIFDRYTKKTWTWKWYDFKQRFRRSK